MAEQLGAEGDTASSRPRGDSADAFGGEGAGMASTSSAVMPLPPAADAETLWGGGGRRGSDATAGATASQREAVLAAAAQLFAGAGFRKVSLEEVAQQAAVDRAVVLALCASKEDLLLQAAAWEVEHFLAEARSWVEARADARQNLRTISERAFEYIGHRPLLLQLMLGALPELAPAAEARAAGLRTRFVGVFEEALRLGVQSGELRRDLPLGMTATLLFELHVASYLLHTRASPDRAQRAAERRQVALDLVLDGLRARRAF